MDIFDLSWIFFFPLFWDLPREKNIPLFHKTDLRDRRCCGLVIPAKEWQFMNVHGAPEPKSE